MASGIFLAAHCGDTLDIPLSIRAGGQAVNLADYNVVLSVNNSVHSGELSADGKQRLIRFSQAETTALGVGEHDFLLTLSGQEYRQTIAGTIKITQPENDSIPTLPIAHIEIENTVSEIEVKTASLVKINKFPQECRDRLDQVEANAASAAAAAATSETAAAASAGNAALSATSAGNSATAAAASEANAAASAANAQNTKLLRYELEIADLKYAAALGWYAELTNMSDTIQAVYNVSDCSKVALHVRSANSAITGNVVLAIGDHAFSVLVGATGAWVELALDGGFSGVIVVKLLSGLSDAGAPVSVVVDGVRVECDYRAAAFGLQSRQVAAKPVLYSDAAGYYMSLDASCGIEFCYPVNGITAVALKIKSANSAITGNAALTLTVGTTSKSAVVAVGASDSWVLIALDAPASGAVKVERNTASADDTLNDSGTVVSAVVSDLNYYYQEN